MKLVFINKSHDEKRAAPKEFAIVNILKSMTESVALENNNEVMLLISPGYLSTTSASSQELYENIFDKKNKLSDWHVEWLQKHSRALRIFK